MALSIGVVAAALALALLLVSSLLPPHAATTPASAMTAIRSTAARM